MNHLAPGIADRFLSATRRLWQRPMILFFHGVNTGIDDPRVQMLHMDRVRFVGFMKSLRRHHRVISVDELADCLESGSQPPMDAVVLTFDDGYLNNLTIVAPIMQSLGLPWSVFVSSRHISESLRFPSYIARVAIYYTEKAEASLPGLPKTISLRTPAARDDACRAVSALLKTTSLSEVERMREALHSLLPEQRWSELNERFLSDQVMTWDQVRQLSRAGARIGAHCHDHAVLHEAQGDDEVWRQVRLSKALIEQQVGECRHFVYPNGKWSDICPAALVALRQTDFRTAMTTVPGFINHSSMPLLLPRFSFETIEQLRRGCARARFAEITGQRLPAVSMLR